MVAEACRPRPPHVAIAGTVGRDTLPTQTRDTVGRGPKIRLPAVDGPTLVVPLLRHWTFSVLF